MSNHLARPRAGVGRTGVIVAMTVALIAQLVVPVAAGAEPVTPAGRLADGLASYTRVVAARGAAPELAARLPLTDRDVRQVLNLPELLGSTVLTDLAAAGSTAGFGDLETLVDAAGDGTDATFDLTVGDEVAGIRDVTLDISVERTVDVPVSYRDVEFRDDAGDVLDEAALEAMDDDAVIVEDTKLALRGGATDGTLATTVTFSLTTDFVFDDSSDTGLLGATAIQDASITASGGNTSLALTGQVGVTEVDAAGSLSFDRAWTMALVDPDGLGDVTRANWEVSLPETILPIASEVATGTDVDAALTLAAAQTPDTHDGTVTWMVADATVDGAAASPTVELGAQLAAFRNVTASDLLGGLTRYAAVVGTAEARADMRVPFTDTTIFDAYSVTERLVEAIQTQSSAMVLCGRSDTSPPLGEDLAGSDWYCQAYTRGEPKTGTVTWSVEGAAVSVTNGTSDATVGTQPSANVHVTGSSGLPDVSVTWTDDDSDEVLRANRRFRTANELAAAVQEELLIADGVTSATVSAGAYDATANSFPLTVTVNADPDLYSDALLEPGNDLAPGARLRDLRPADVTTAGVDITLGTVTLESTLDISLAPRDAALLEQPERVSLTTPNDALLTVASLSAETDADPVDLTGRVGYVGMDVEATGFAVSTHESSDAVTVALGTAGGVGLDTVLADPVAELAPSWALSATGDASVEAERYGTAFLPAGDHSLAISWADVTPTSAPSVTPRTAYETDVFPLDVSPTVSGEAGGTSTATDLVDTGAGFFTAFGLEVDPDTELDAVLVNTATGASCLNFVVVDDNTLTCVDGLAGGTVTRDPETGEAVDADADGEPDEDNTWHPGDGYEVKGDSTAVGGLLTEGLVDLALRLGAVQGAGLDEALPLIGVTPSDLLPQFGAVSDGLSVLVPRIAEAGETGTVGEPTADTPEGAIDDLQALEDEIDALDGISVDLSIESLANPLAAGSVSHLVARVTADASGSLTGEDAPTLRATLDNDGDELLLGTDAAVSPAAGATPDVTWTSTVQLDVAVPLSIDVDPSRLLVLSTTGVTALSVSVDADTLDLTGRLGALDVIAGNSAYLQGTHEAVVGEHDANPLVDGSVTGIPTVSGTADTPASATVLTDGEGAFSSLGAGGTLTNTTDSASCTVASVTATTLTCDAALPDSKTFDAGDSYTYAPPSNASAFTDTGGVSGASEGDVVVHTGGGVCAIASIAGNTVTCSAALTSGTFADGDDYVVLDSRVLSHEDGVTESIVAGQTLVHVGTDDSCEIASADAGAGTITCTDPLGPGITGWAVGDAWSVDADSTTVLYAPGTGFDELGLRLGHDEVRKMNSTGTTVDASCVVTAVDADSITCDAGLSDGESWNVGDVFEIGRIGVIDLGIGFTLAATGHELLDGGDEYDSFVDEVVGEITGDASTCDVASGFAGAACLRLSLAASNPETGVEPYLGTVEIVITDDGTETSTVPDRAAAVAASAELDLTLLGAPLAFLPPLLADALDGYANEDTETRAEGWSTSEVLVPLVGSDLAAGADVAGTMEQVAASLLDLDTYDGEITDLDDEVATLLAGLVDVQVGVLTVTCGTGNQDCTNPDPELVEIAVDIGQNLAAVGTDPTQGCATGCGTTAGTVAFDSGLPGLSFAADAELDATRAWQYHLVFGVDRATGPYVKVGSASDLVVGAQVSIPELGNSLVNECSNEPGAITPSSNAFGGQTVTGTELGDYETGDGTITNARCFDAQLGLLGGSVYDGDTDLPTNVAEWAFDADAPVASALTQKTRLDLLTSVDLEGPGGADQLSAVDLVERTETRTLDVDAHANVDLYALSDKDLPGGNLPAVHASLHFAYDHDQENPLIGEVEYRDIVVDTRSFFDDFLGPWVGDTLEVIGVMRPVADFLLTPIPGLSDVAEAIGNPPISLFTIAQEASGQDLTLLYNLLEFIRFADTVANGLAENINSEDAFVGLNGSAPNPNCDVTQEGNTCGLSTEGGFKLEKEKARESGPCGSAIVKGKKTKVSKTCTKTTRTAKKGGNVSASLTGVSAGKKTENIKQLEDCAGECTGKERARTISKSVGGGLSAPGLAFPFLSDSQQMYGMLVGVDAELVRLDLGDLSLNVGMQFTWGPFMAGPVPVDIGIGGNVSATMRTMVGLDTLGMRTTGKLLDGFFINDLDPAAGNKDVAEITLTFSVSLSAAISIKVFRAGIEGTVAFIIGADLVDPDGDGRVRPDEIAAAGAEPWCVFALTGSIRLILSVFAELDFKFWSKTWSYELFRRTWKLFEIKCEVEDPVLAVEVTGGSDGNEATLELEYGHPLNEGDVVLTSGPLYARRNIQEDEADEVFTVRQMATDPTTGKTAITVEAFALSQQFTLGSGDRVVAAMGGGDDALVFTEGVGADPDDVHPFTLRTSSHLGAGRDSVEGGEGPDEVFGGDDKDTIKGNGGNDDLHGGGGNDSIDGGLGADVIWGDAGDDRLTGAQGGDAIDGGAGDDRISAGPGMATTQAARIARLQLVARGNANPDASQIGALASTLADGDDVLVGGLGSDELSGHYGADVIVGGELTGFGRSVLTTAPVVTAICARTSDDDGDAGDVIDGGPGDDVLAGSGGADQITGLRGDDTLCGGPGNDVLRGDGGDAAMPAGDDTVFGGAGDDTIDGAGGNDALHGDAGADHVDGGDGDDSMTGGAGPDLLASGPGDDVVDGDGLDPGVGDVSDGSVTVCEAATTVEDGLVRDLDGTVLASGRVGGHLVISGKLDTDRDGDADEFDNGLLGDVLIVAGELDVNADSAVDAADDGLLPVTVMVADGWADCVLAGADDDIVTGGAGGDRLLGEAGDDGLGGDDGDDVIRGGDGVDTINGDAGADVLWGDQGGDTVYGDDGDDEAHGGGGNDTIEGNAGVDTLYGEGGNDTLLGGSSQAGASDTGDALISGGPGVDVLIGDNGTLAGVLHDLPDAADVAGSVVAAGGDPDLGGGDLLQGDGGTDIVLGGLGDDTIHGDGNSPVGGSGADTIEGNTGNDTLHGDNRADTMLGGTSDIAAGGDAAGLADGADTINGGNGDDVIVGDNGTRAGTPLDLPTGGDATVEATGGDDLIHGDADDDRIRSGVGDDTVHGDAGADYVEGNTDDDEIHGGTGTDVLIGGTSTADHTDTHDAIHGDGGDDVIAGDNASIDQQGTLHLLDVLLDDAVDGDDDGVSGGDDLEGGGSDDRIHGQGGPDNIAGGTGDDVIEGNHDADTIAGGAGDDDIIGGGSAADGVIDDGRTGDGLLDGADLVHGDGADVIDTTTDPFGGTFVPDLADSGADVLAGDNARITRPVGTNDWDGSLTRLVVLFDVATTTSPAATGTSDADEMYGGDGNDHLYGQGGDEITLEGNAGDDVIEGNHGDDLVVGGPGNDDLIGGGSADDGVLDDDRDPSDLLDGRDVIVGDTDTAGATEIGDGDDVAAGDNAWIERLVAADGTWSAFDFKNPDGDQSIISRTVTMTDAGPGDTSGSDLVYGNGGHDDLYGQFDDGSTEPLVDVSCDGHDVASVPGDLLCGGDGDDGILGDQGDMTAALADDVADEFGVSTDDTIATAGRFADAIVFVSGTMIRQVVLTQVQIGGDDVLFGGNGEDAIHAGAGDDLANAGPGNDAVFGDDGVDVVWGGVGDDRLYGGFGGDDLDIKPRRDIPDFIDDPAIWFEVAPMIDQDGDPLTTNDSDIIYGGEDADSLQADVAANGPHDGDRLFDWFGAYNINYVCASTNGAAVYSRGPAPATRAFLNALATDDGLVEVLDATSAGNRELALVTGGNKNPPHPDTPGHFTCEGEGGSRG